MIAAALALLLALPPLLLYLRNVRLFVPPPQSARPYAISALVPARNEEAAIAACLQSILASEHVELEVLVLDDHSTDRTAAIVEEIAKIDPRVKLLHAPELPAGWSGKQHACFVLGRAATKPLLCFLDADVRLEPLALCRMAAFQEQSQAALVSGFPRQSTVGILEKLLIPLMHFLLLGFLPISRMRTHKDASLGAGCGQFFLTTKAAYEQVGGHAAVKTSFHDGVQLPRAYRRAGLMTDLADITALVSCRMYMRPGQVWQGLAKNAREGLATPVGVWIWTVLLGVGQVLPWVLAFTLEEPIARMLAGLAGLCGLTIRMHAAWRFEQSWLGALLHPVGISLLLCIQWYATVRAWVGRPVAWKGRAQPAKAP
jgi:hypothetical protein